MPKIERVSGRNIYHAREEPLPLSAPLQVVCLTSGLAPGRAVANRRSPAKNACSQTSHATLTAGTDGLTLKSGAVPAGNLLLKSD